MYVAANNLDQLMSLETLTQEPSKYQSGIATYILLYSVHPFALPRPLQDTVLPAVCIILFFTSLGLLRVRRYLTTDSVLAYSSSGTVVWRSFCIYIVAHVDTVYADTVYVNTGKVSLHNMPASCSLKRVIEKPTFRPA